MALEGRHCQQANHHHDDGEDIGDEKIAASVRARCLQMTAADWFLISAPRTIAQIAGPLVSAKRLYRNLFLILFCSCGTCWFSYRISQSLRRFNPARERAKAKVAPAQCAIAALNQDRGGRL